MAKLVPAKCPSCGATVVVDPDVEVCKCEYCENAFITTKAITNYTTNIYNTKQDNEYTVNVEKEKTKQASNKDKSRYKNTMLMILLLVILMIYTIVLRTMGA